MFTMFRSGLYNRVASFIKKKNKNKNYASLQVTLLVQNDKKSQDNSYHFSNFCCFSVDPRKYVGLFLTV